MVAGLGWEPGAGAARQRRRLDPAWRRAPSLLLRSPAVLAAVAVTALLLGMTAASGSLFVASAANAALDYELGQLQPELAGLTVATRALGGEAAYARADEALRERVGATLPELGEPVAMLLSSPVTLVAGEQEMRVRLLARTGALDRLDATAGRPEAGGVSLPAGLARGLGAQAGGELELEYGGRRLALPLASVHADLGGPPLPDYWRRLEALIVPREGPTGPEVPLPLLVTDHATLQRAAAELRFGSNAQWEFPLVAEGLVAGQARDLVRRYRQVEVAIRNPDAELGAALDALTEYSTQLGASSSLGPATQRVDEAVVALTPPVQTLSLAGVAVALLVLGAAGAFRTRRRRTEHTLLGVQGVSPGGQALRAVVETAPTILLGVGAGWQVAALAIRWLGPSPRLGGAIAGTTLRHVGLAAAVGVVVLGLVTLQVIVRDSRVESSRLRQVAARTPWEVAVLALSAAAYYQLTLRSSALVSSGDAVRVDVLLLLFPLLFLAGLVGVAVRLLRRLLPALRTWGSSLRTAPYLAVRRLTGASTTAMLLVTASSMSLGILVYAGALADSADASATAKAQVAIGADVTTPLPRGVDRFDRLLPQATVVARGEGQLLPDDQPVDILAVDPATFARTVHWDDGFADEPLADLLAAIEGPAGARVPVAVVGADPGRDVTLRSARFAFPVDPVASATTFPTMRTGRPVVVLDYDAFLEAFAGVAPSSDATRVLATELWARGEPERVVGFLEAHGLPAQGLQTVAEVRGRPSMQSIGWTLGYLQALGVLAGVLALAATLLYLQERQQAREVSYALASRMGLDRRAHRRAVALELAGMLVTALALGGMLALAAARLVVPRLDPLPEVPPPPAMALPGATLLTLAFAVGLVCWAGAWVVQGSADRTRVGEVLRVAD